MKTPLYWIVASNKTKLMVLNGRGFPAILMRDICELLKLDATIQYNGISASSFVAITIWLFP